MSTELKNVAFGDKVLKEDANQSVGNFTAGTISATTVTAQTVAPTYLKIGNNTYSLSLNGYGYLVLTLI